MSTIPSDKRRARQKKGRPWYLRPITFQVVVLVGRFVLWILDHI